MLIYLNFSKNEEEDPNLYLFYLKNYTLEIKMNDYYYLSDSTQKIINATAELAPISDQATLIGTSMTIMVSPGSTFSIGSIIAIGFIKQLRNLDIDYPPNLIAFFNSKDDKNIFLQFLYIKHGKGDGEIDSNLINYGASIYILNNVGDKIIILAIIFLIALIVFMIETIIKI